MSDSNFLNVEEIVLLSSCLFTSTGFRKAPSKTLADWADFALFARRVLNRNIYAVVFGIEYYQKIVQNRNAQKNLVAATLFFDCLKTLLACSFDSGTGCLGLGFFHCFSRFSGNNALRF